MKLVNEKKQQKFKQSKKARVYKSNKVGRFGVLLVMTSKVKVYKFISDAVMN